MIVLRFLFTWPSWSHITKNDLGVPQRLPLSKLKFCPTSDDNLKEVTFNPPPLAQFHQQPVGSLLLRIKLSKLVDAGLFSWACNTLVNVAVVVIGGMGWMGVVPNLMADQFHSKLFHIEACGDGLYDYVSSRRLFAKLPKLFVIEAAKIFGITLPKRPCARY